MITDYIQQYSLLKFKFFSFDKAKKPLFFIFIYLFLSSFAMQTMADNFKYKGEIETFDQIKERESKYNQFFKGEDSLYFYSVDYKISDRDALSTIYTVSAGKHKEHFEHEINEERNNSLDFLSQVLLMVDEKTVCPEGILEDKKASIKLQSRNFFGISEIFEYIYAYMEYFVTYIENLFSNFFFNILPIYIYSDNICIDGSEGHKEFKEFKNKFISLKDQIANIETNEEKIKKNDTIDKPNLSLDKKNNLKSVIESDAILIEALANIANDYYMVSYKTSQLIINDVNVYSGSIFNKITTINKNQDAKRMAFIKKSERILNERKPKFLKLYNHFKFFQDTYSFWNESKDAGSAPYGWLIDLNEVINSEPITSSETIKKLSETWYLAPDSSESFKFHISNIFDYFKPSYDPYNEKIDNLANLLKEKNTTLPIKDDRYKIDKVRYNAFLIEKTDKNLSGDKKYSFNVLQNTFLTFKLINADPQAMVNFSVVNKSQNNKEVKSGNIRIGANGASDDININEEKLKPGHYELSFSGNRMPNYLVLIKITDDNGKAIYPFMSDKKATDQRLDYDSSYMPEWAKFSVYFKLLEHASPNEKEISLANYPYK